MSGREPSPNDSAAAGAPPMMVYDGECGFCSRAVQFMIRRDPGGALRFAAREGDAGRRVRERHPALRQVESLLWVEWVDGKERVTARSAAVLRAAIYLGGIYGALGRAGFMVPALFRDPVYAAVARVRKRIFGTVDQSCLVIPPQERARFLP